MKWVAVTLVVEIVILGLIATYRYKTSLLLEKKPAMFEETNRQPIQPVKTGELSIVGNKVVNNNGDEVVLKGVTTDEFRFNNIYSDIDDLKERILIVRGWGVNLLVLYLQQPNKVLGRVDEIVELTNWATENGLYTLLFPVVHQYDTVPKEDAHLSSEKTTYTPNGNNTKYILNLLSSKLKNNNSVIFGLGAEPNNVSFDEYRNWQTEIIDSIRSNNPKSLVMVNGIMWGRYLEKYINNPISRPNILYDTHRYTASKPSLVKLEKCTIPTEYVGKLPFILGEFGGVYDTGFGDDQDLRCIDRYLTTAKENNIGFAMHTIDFSSRLGLLNFAKFPTKKGRLFKSFLMTNYN